MGSLTTLGVGREMLGHLYYSIISLCRTPRDHSKKLEIKKVRHKNFQILIISCLLTGQAKRKTSSKISFNIINVFVNITYLAHIFAIGIQDYAFYIDFGMLEKITLIWIKFTPLLDR